MLGTAGEMSCAHIIKDVSVFPLYIERLIKNLHLTAEKLKDILFSPFTKFQYRCNSDISQQYFCIFCLFLLLF